MPESLPLGIVAEIRFKPGVGTRDHPYNPGSLPPSFGNFDGEEVFKQKTQGILEPSRA